MVWFRDFRPRTGRKRGVLVLPYELRTGWNPWESPPPLLPGSLRSPLSPPPPRTSSPSDISHCGVSSYPGQSIGVSASRLGTPLGSQLSSPACSTPPPSSPLSSPSSSSRSPPPSCSSFSGSPLPRSPSLPQPPPPPPCSPASADAPTPPPLPCPPPSPHAASLLPCPRRWPHAAAAAGPLPSPQPPAPPPCSPASADAPHAGDDRQYTRTVDTILHVNKNFNPQSSPPRNLRIQRPVSDYIDENKQRKKLTIQKFPERQKRAAMNNDVIDYYTYGVANLDVYIDSAFRSTRQNEVYLFMGNEYVLLDYAPVTKKDRVIQGPLFISNGFGSLVGTAFSEYGIDAAFGCHGLSEAFIFSGNLSAKINYAQGSTNDGIVEGPNTIKQMFPFFKGTNFEKWIDAGFESTRTGEAYLFSGAEYALINYSERTLIAKGNITEGFSCLRETMFASDIGAAFASHRDNEAYLLKDNNYVQLYFTPGEKRDYIIGGPKEIVPSNWPSLKDILPRKNRGLDIYESDRPIPERDQDD